MKYEYVLGIFTACFPTLIFTNTNSRPVLNHNQYTTECTHPGFCAIRDDDFCRWFKHICDMDDINCALESLWRLWFKADDDSQCQYVKKPNQGALCKFACPVEKCKPNGIACSLDYVNNICTVVEDVCVLKKSICIDRSQRGLAKTEPFHADFGRCKRAGLTKIGDKGPC